MPPSTRTPVDRPTAVPPDRRPRRPALPATVVLLLALTASGLVFAFGPSSARTGHTTRDAVVRALAATGGVITSAGIVLAAVFAVLGVLPIIVLTQIGVIVGLGVLLDTLVVRTVLVPSLAMVAASAPGGRAG